MTQSSRHFPSTRLRRLRQSGWIRDLVQENHLRPSDLIYPIFVTEGQNHQEDIASMPGQSRASIDLSIEKLKQAHDLGIKAAALFPCTPDDKKTDDGKEAYNPDNLICRALNEIKNALPDLGLIADVALDPYTAHGHDGIMKGDEILNDETNEILAKQAVCQAQAGADIIAPSDMMDGRIGVIRSALDDNGLQNTTIFSYAAKYASAFYGPFRDAVGSGAKLRGDKKTYQMNPANSQEALREIEMDIAEGADMVMIKPGLPYLDIIRQSADHFDVPVMAYHVSGEYATLRAAEKKGWLDYESALFETLLGFKRAGCSAILTYGAIDAARLLKD